MVSGDWRPPFFTLSLGTMLYVRRVFRGITGFEARNDEFPSLGRGTRKARINRKKAFSLNYTHFHWLRIYPMLFSFKFSFNGIFLGDFTCEIE